jgi:hypothetical protein
MRIGLLVFCVAALGPAIASAQDAAELVALINTYRSAPQDCAGKRTVAVNPLAPDAHLDNVPTQSGRPLQDALKARGYPAARAFSITVSGPRDAGAVMNLIKRSHCGPLLDAQYSSIGVSREGRTWRIALARPVLSANLGEWRAAGEEVLRLTNSARAQPRTCGRRRFAAAPPLRWAGELGLAAFIHSRDMATRNYFDHRAPTAAAPMRAQDARATSGGALGRTSRPGRARRSRRWRRGWPARGIARTSWRANSSRWVLPMPSTSTASTPSTGRRCSGLGGSRARCSALLFRDRACERLLVHR